MQLNLSPSTSLESWLVQIIHSIRKHLRSSSRDLLLPLIQSNNMSFGRLWGSPWKWTSLVIVNIPLTYSVLTRMHVCVLCECVHAGLYLCAYLCSKCSILRLLHSFVIYANELLEVEIIILFNLYITREKYVSWISKCILWKP
jgi:hypothetical protein